MIAPILLATRNILRKFILSGPLQNTNTVTIKDLNYVIQEVNNRIYYRPFDFFLTQSGTSAPSMSIVMAGNCPHSCSGSADNCECPNFMQEGSGSQRLVSSVERLSLGTYRINFTPGHPSLINRGYSVFVEPLPDQDVKVVIDKKTSATSLIIKTYNSATAALVDGKLDGTGFSLRFYTYLT